MSNIYKYIYIVWSFRPPISPIVKSTKMSIFLQGVHTIYMKFNQGLREHLGAQSFTTSLKVDLSRHKLWVLHLAGALMVHVFAPTPVVNYWHPFAKMKKSPILQSFKSSLEKSTISRMKVSKLKLCPGLYMLDRVLQYWSNKKNYFEVAAFLNFWMRNFKVPNSNKKTKNKKTISVAGQKLILLWIFLLFIFFVHLVEEGFSTYIFSFSVPYLI